MKIVIPGGSGHVGASLIKAFSGEAHEIVVLSRNAGKANGYRTVQWDGVHLGDWQSEIDGADVVINLAGRTVNCRYNAENLWQMMDSRVLSTQVIGQAIAKAKHPPSVWIQSSTATIYADSLERANGESNGVVGEGDFSDMPPRPGETGSAPRKTDKWRASQAIARAWEKELEDAPTPNTRKVAIRSSMVMAPIKDSVFSVMANLASVFLGGTVGNGRQFVSWIHEADFCRAVKFLIEHSEMSGAVNVCSPNPVRNREFNRALRAAVGLKVGLPLPAPILEIGALLMRTESELLLKSRCVVPERLLEAGFEFEFPVWDQAAEDLARKLFSRGAPILVA